MTAKLALQISTTKHIVRSGVAKWAKRLEEACVGRWVDVSRGELIGVDTNASRRPSVVITSGAESFSQGRRQLAAIDARYVVDVALRGRVVKPREEIAE